VRHPKALVPEVQYNIKHHLPKLTIDLNAARKDMGLKRYSMLGEDLGRMLAIVTTPVPTEMPDPEESHWSISFEVIDQIDF
jgi:hypothetical protein